MIDLKEYLCSLIEKYAIGSKTDIQTTMTFLVNNSWFGSKPSVVDGRVFLSQQQLEIITPRLITFLSTETDALLLLQDLHHKFPETSRLFEKFIDAKKKEITEDDIFYITDFLLFRLHQDIVLYTDDNIEELLRYATQDLTRTHGDWLTYFLAWVRSRYRTAYFKDYIMAKRYTMTIQSQAYDIDTYLELMYYLFNEDYITENDMLAKAAQDQNYTDTWLYLAMHFISALRYPDLKRIYYPTLPYSAEEVLRRVSDGSFSETDARTVLLSITNRLCWLPLKPSKTAAKSGVSDIKLHFPDSCEVLFGTLFALAAAHRQLNGKSDTPIIRKINGYKQITNYMGEEIGHLFLEGDFRGRSANKSYLQSVYALTDDILDDNDGRGIKGYILASLARSHKGAYGEFAETTFVYLKDAAFSGMSPQFVAFEMLQRGVLSYIPEMLLKIVTTSEYEKLTPKQKTAAIQTVGLSASETEMMVGIVNKGKNQAKAVLAKVLTSEMDIISILHKIGSGQAVSKQAESLCLMTAVGKTCPYAIRRQCVGCEYEISTKATFYLLVSEFNRMNLLYKTATDPLEKKKYESLIKEIVISRLDEMLHCLRESYGEDVYTQYEQFLKENLST